MGLLSKVIDSLSQNVGELDSNVNRLGVTLNELKSFLGNDWNDYRDNPRVLIAWAELLSENRLMDQGISPGNFTTVTHCNGCGEVFVPPELVNDGQVIACPWCFNRALGLPIPRKQKTQDY